MRIPFAVPARGERRFDVVGLGLNSIDLIAVVAEYPEQNSKQPLQRFARLPGGETATAMAVCARLGWDASYIGSFGDDEFGRASAQSLVAAGVSIDAARVVRGATSQFAVILVDARSGDRTVLWDRDPKLTLNPDEVLREPATAGRLLVVDSVQTAAATRAATHARAAGIPTILDIDKVRPGTQDLLRQIDVIIGAETLPGELTGYDEPGRALAAMASEYGAAVVCVTLGSEGSLARVKRPGDSDAGVFRGLRRHDGRRRCLPRRIRRWMPGSSRRRHRGRARVRERRRRAQLPGAWRARRDADEGRS